MAVFLLSGGSFLPGASMWDTLQKSVAYGFIF